jgi:archaellum component FlaC
MGMLTVLWINSTYQTFQTNKTNKDIEGKLNVMETYVYDTSQHLMDQYMGVSESMAKVTMQLESIQKQLNDTDLASTLIRLEEEIAALQQNINVETQSLAFHKKSTERNFNKTFNDIQSCRTALNQLAQDPNLMSRY